jgi:prepilin signal peptidase PulO-like enzyme (type II secretory pathway)
VRGGCGCGGLLRSVLPARSCSMSSNFLAVLAFALAGAVGSPLLVRLASRRAAAQPVTYDPGAEQVVLAWGWEHPEDAVEMAEAGVQAGSFAHPGRAKAWEVLSGAVRTGFTVADVERARAGLCDEGSAALAEADASEESIEIGRAAGRVLDAAEDREVFAGRLAVERTGTHPPLRRVYREPGISRYLVAAAVMAAYGAVSAALAPGRLSALLLLFVGAYGYVCSAIDHDTMLIDDRTVVVGSATAWAGVLGVVAAGEISWGAAGLGLGSVVVWGVVFELINAAYKRIRHQDGLGFGDTLIIVVCAGVPAAVSGSWIVGAYSVFGAFLLAILWSLPAMLRGTRGRKDPFALGPFLAAGWVFAWGIASWVGVA